MDWVSNAKTNRDNAISVFQEIDNAPQVRARALIYADVMQHMLGDKEPRPKTIPSLTTYQCALNAVVLKSYVEHRQAMGSMSYAADDFIAWADDQRASPSMEILSNIVECMIEHMQVFAGEYEGTSIGPDEMHELNRTLAIHAFAVLTAVFAEAESKGEKSPLMHLLLEVSPSEWQLKESIFPLLANVRAVFSVEQGWGKGKWADVDTAPSIVGFLLADAKKVFFIEPDQEEGERLVSKGEGMKQISQGQLNANMISTHTALEEETYPSFPGQKVTIQVVSNEGILPRQDADDMDDENVEEQEDGEASESSSTAGLSKPPGIFADAYRDALTKMGMKNPQLQELRTQLDYAIFTGNGHAVLHFFQTLGDKFDEVLPTLGYGNNPLTQALAKQVYGNDDFYGATVFNVFTIDPRALYGDEPLTRALEEEKYEIACAIATHDGKYKPADELGTTWVRYRDQLSDQGTPYVTWQVLNCVAFSADEEAHATAISSIAEPGEESTYLSYHKQMAQAFLTSGGPYKVAAEFFNSQLTDDAADELDGEEAEDVSPEGDENDDTSELTRRLRDGALMVFRNPEAPPQVRVRAYLYADTMQVYLGEKEPQPQGIPSLVDYQCAMIGTILLVYVNEVREQDGRFGLSTKHFCEWSQNVQETLNPMLSAVTGMLKLTHILPLVSPPNTLSMSVRELQELDRFVTSHAFAIIAVLIQSSGEDGLTPLKNLCEKVEDTEWGQARHIMPLIARYIRPLFTLEGPSSMVAPQITGFTTSDFDTSFFFRPDSDEFTRLLIESGKADDDEVINAFTNVMEIVAKNGSDQKLYMKELQNLPKQVGWQVVAAKNAAHVYSALKACKYPSQDGQEARQLIPMTTTGIANVTE
jgi:hypothetical protein